jgi:hypothetical protein
VGQSFSAGWVVKLLAGWVVDHPQILKYLKKRSKHAQELNALLAEQHGAILFAVSHD